MALPLALGVLITAVGGVAAGMLLAGPAEDRTPPATIKTTPSERTRVVRGGGTSTTRTGTTPENMVRGEKARQARIPILMYHVLGTPPSSSALPELWVGKERFREQMAALHKAGYEAITLKAAFGAWETGGPLPLKPVIVSFDDGYLSHATVAAPALKRYGWPGVLNLSLKNLGKDGLPRRLAEGMVKDGWEVDSHTLTHPDLRNISAAQLKTELVDSRKQIKEMFGVDAQFLCYPAGKHDEGVIAAAKSAGYTGATTVEPGIASRANGKYELPRVRITNADSGNGLVQRLKDAG